MRKEGKEKGGERRQTTLFRIGYLGILSSSLACLILPIFLLIDERQCTLWWCGLSWDSNFFDHNTYVTNIKYDIYILFNQGSAKAPEADGRFSGLGHNNFLMNLFANLLTFTREGTFEV